jgi:hypothetical protein
MIYILYDEYQVMTTTDMDEAMEALILGMSLYGYTESAIHARVMEQDCELKIREGA